MKLFKNFKILLASVMFGLLVFSNVSAVTFNRDLTVGSRGDDVTTLQNFLISRGLLEWPTEASKGFYGTLTTNAVKAWQSSNNISPASGIINSASRILLNSQVSNSNTPTTNPSTCQAFIPADFLIKTSFNNNEVGTEVETIRDHMIEKGFLSNTKSLDSCGKAKFDSDLISAINRYKTSNKIRRTDSLLDPITFSLINSELGFKDKVHPNVPAGYSFCAVEGSTCTFTGTKDVIYGTNNKWSSPKTNRASSIMCSNSNFNDPVRNKTKGCFIKDSSTTNTPPTTPTAPTAELKINGAKEFIMTPASTLPTITWSSTNGSSYSAKLNVNSQSKCLISSGTTWTFGGNTASGSYTLRSNDASNKIGCDMTLVYTVRSSNGATSSDSVIIKYRDNPSTPPTTPTAPTAELKINGAKEFIMTPASTLPTITWSSTNGSSYSAKLNVNSQSKCLISSGTTWTFGGNTASGSYTLRSNDASNKIGCDMTLVYTVRSSNGATSSDSVIIKYRDNPSTPPTTPAGPTSLNRTLKVGDEGTDVAVVQEALKNKGFFSGEITGFFGRLTSAAVSAFQQANALEVVGEVGPRTKTLLNSLLGN